MDTIGLQLRDMSCAGCGSAIEKAIHAVSRVIECNINFDLE